MEDGIRGLRRKATPPPPYNRQSEQPATRPEAEQPHGREAVASALRKYVEAFEAARQALAEGHTPNPDALEAARATLLSALAASDLGADCALLQRFLRSTALELSAVLRAPGAQTAMLAALFDRHRAAFETARAQAATFLSQPPASVGRPFWDRSI
jgi:hypothetical protein